MTNLIEQAINCDDGERASKIIRDALGIESDDVANYCFSKEWPVVSPSLHHPLRRRNIHRCCMQT
jgi:hypothetical protein